MNGGRWWAWLAIYAVASALAGFSDWLVDAVGEGHAAGIYGLIGIALGWAWFRLYPRPLVERLRLISILIIAASLLVACVGGELADADASVMIPLGVLAGLVLSETRRLDAASWRPEHSPAPRDPGLE